MKGRVILRSQVPDDLAAIVDYLAERSPAAASRFIQSAQDTLSRLAAAPGIGSPKEFRSRRLVGIRSWPVAGFPNHLVFYRPVEDGIEVLGVLHGARNIRSVLRERQR